MNKEHSHIYFVGVGGIGMSALARYFNQLGKKVAGYDKTITDLTKRLQTEGISVNYIDEADSVPFPYRSSENTLVVYTPAIPSDNAILNYFIDNDFNCLKRAEVLGEISRSLPTIAVSGTHGKTTISSMIAFLLAKSGIKINAFLGGISRDFGTNLILNEDAKLVVTEADEFDRSFLQLHPNHLVITSVDKDHLDIYEDENDLYQTYSKLVKQVDSSGLVLSKLEVFNKLNASESAQKISYHISDKVDVYAENIRVEEGKIVFDYCSAQNHIKDIKCGLPGIHNVENAIAAIYLAIANGVSASSIPELMAEYHGVKRRFDVHIHNQDLVYIDDYAHHPKEINSVYESLKLLYPNKKITAIFQPHLYSRTRDFAEDFAKELSRFDELILLELYPARELPIDEVSSLWLSKKIKKENVPVCQKSHLINILKERNVEVLVTIGAGDIDQMVEPIINFYAE